MKTLITEIEILESKIKTLIQENYNLNKCKKCNTEYFNLLDTNSSGTGIEIQCTKCMKKSWSKISTLDLSDKDEKGKFFPDNGEENLFTASRFVSSSKSLILKLTFLLSKSNSKMAASILSPPTKRDGLASAEFIAICDFFIVVVTSLPSGFTTSPFESDEITFTVIVSLIFLSLNQSKGSF